MGVVRPPPKAKPKKISKFFLALGGGRTTSWGHKATLDQATPLLNWGGQPPHLFPSFILNFFYYFNFCFLFKN
jgi:hypothetical protein